MPPVRNVSADAGESQPVGVTMHSGTPPPEEMAACFVERFPVVAGGSTAWGFLNRRGGTQADRDVSQRSTPKVPGVDDVEGAAGRLPWLHCVSPQRFRLPVHHQYSILPLSTNMKATSAPAGGRCCKSDWLSGGQRPTWNGQRDREILLRLND
jgi:hypothetical protein